MKTLTIIGRRWFQKTYGNTYHSATILIDGAPAGQTGTHYGYGDSYLQTAFEQLEKEGKINPPREVYSNGGREPETMWARRVGVTLHYSATDVAREKDL